MDAEISEIDISKPVKINPKLSAWWTPLQVREKISFFIIIFWVNQPSKIFLLNLAPPLHTVSSSSTYMREIFLYNLITSFFSFLHGTLDPFTPLTGHFQCIDAHYKTL